MKQVTLACLLLGLFVSLSALAQSTKTDEPPAQDNSKSATQEKGTEKGASTMKTVTGCLQKGDEPDEFSLTTADGKIWGLHSSTVKLDQHVGHKVTVTGAAMKESEAEEQKEKREGEVEKASKKAEYADMRVSNLKMVSDSCK